MGLVCRSFLENGSDRFAECFSLAATFFDVSDMLCTCGV